ncbi:MAG TPA: amidase family protein, partial [Burkholderiales bacterium]
RSPYERKTGRVPGGSSSGAAVSVADGMCVMGLGTDTRGSVRIPAAACGIAGFKPTARRVPREGAFPLSFTLDSIGPLANSIACCAAYDSVLAGEAPAPLAALPTKGIRLLVPRSTPLQDLDDAVGKAFGSALSRLAQAGAQVIEAPVPAFDRQGEYFRQGGFAGAEAYYVHRRYLERISEYDPRVGKRIILGKDISAADYLAFADLRAAYIAEVQAAAAPFDAIAMPTLPCVPPTVAEASADDDAYFRWNLRMLRNCGLVNFLDGCAATLPCSERGAAPVGFMVCGPAGTDRHVLAVAAAIERTLSAN